MAAQLVDDLVGTLRERAAPFAGSAKTAPSGPTWLETQTVQTRLCWMPTVSRLRPSAVERKQLWLVAIPWPRSLQLILERPIRIQRRFSCASPAEWLTPELGRTLICSSRRAPLRRGHREAACRDSQGCPWAWALASKAARPKPKQGHSRRQTFRTQGHGQQPMAQLATPDQPRP